MSETKEQKRYDLSDLDALEPIEIPFNYNGKEYTLREASGSAATFWRNRVTAATKMGPGGRVQGFKNLADTEPLLVHLCLFDNATGENVPENVVKGWPNRIMKRLYDMAIEISGLDDERDEVKVLRDVLERPDSPVSYDELNLFLSDLREHDPDSYGELAYLTDEDRAKNYRRSTMDGSG